MSGTAQFIILVLLWLGIGRGGGRGGCCYGVADAVTVVGVTGGIAAIIQMQIYIRSSSSSVVVVVIIINSIVVGVDIQMLRMDSVVVFGCYCCCFGIHHRNCRYNG